MAGTQFTGGKYHGSKEVKAHFRHDDKKLRENTKEHQNPNIDTAKTVYNYSILGLSYQEKCDKYDKRIAKIDSNPNNDYRTRRKTRVTLQSMIVYLPDGIDKTKQQQWFKDVSDILIDKYGIDNFIDADIHVDELHEYYDKDTKSMQMSKIHGHFKYVPEIDGRLNGKEFSSRANINDVNNRIHQMSMTKYHVPYMTGKGTKNGKTVEQLKADSLYHQVYDELDDMKSDLEIENYAVSQQAERNKQDAENNKALQEALEAEKEVLRQDRYKFTLEKEKWQEKANNELEELKKQLEDSYETQVEELNRALNKAMADYKNKLDAEYQRKEDALEAQFKVRVEEATERRLAAAQREQFQEAQQMKIRRRLPGEPEF